MGRARRRGSSLSAGAFVLALALGERAAAHEPPGDPAQIELQWSGPPQCPAREEVVRRAEVHIKDDARPVVAVGVVTSQADESFALALSLRAGDAEEQRQLEAESCDALADAAALLIAVAADPAQPLGSQPGAPVAPLAVQPSVADAVVPSEPEREPEPTAATTATEPEIAPSPAPLPARPLRALVRVDAVGQFLRVLPRSAGVGVSGAAGIRIGRAGAEARGHYFFGQPREYDDRAGVGGVFDLWTLGAVGCFAPTLGRIEFPVCGGAEVGSMRGRSRGVTEEGLARSIFAGVLVEGGVAYAPVDRVALRAAAQGIASLTRPEFHVRDLGPLFSAGPAALRLIAGIEVRFGSR